MKHAATVIGILLCAASASAQSARDVFVTTPDGAKIHCLDAGRGPAPAVLLVPGWTMPADIWERQIAHLQTMYRVVAMDPRAQGQSSPAADGLSPPRAPATSKRSSTSSGSRRSCSSDGRWR